jgi:hypothetical protein
MTTKLQAKEQSDRTKTDNEKLSTALGGHILRALGQPKGLHSVQVRRLWDGHFRVNVLVGGDITTVRVAHSFFVSADGAGNILTSMPALPKCDPLDGNVASVGLMPDGRKEPPCATPL